MASRFLTNRHIENVVDRINKELINDFAGQKAILYKVNVNDTKTNIYGESVGGFGKIYNNGVELPCLINANDIDWNTDEFGPSSGQTATFAFHRTSLIELNVRPEIGDILDWNYAYFEINSLNENKLLAGDPDKNHDLVATAHLTKRSRLNIEERQR